MCYIEIRHKKTGECIVRLYYNSLEEASREHSNVKLISNDYEKVVIID